jgi:hypothetical protein
MRILGLSGKKQSGKNTAANQLIVQVLNMIGFDAKLNEHGKIIVVAEDGNVGILDTESRDEHILSFMAKEVWPYIKTYSFAMPLKDFCIGILGLTEEQCFGNDEQKNSNTHLLWENMPGVITSELPVTTLQSSGLIIHDSGPMTARDVLQFFGTNICRKMYNNVWVDALIRQIKSENVNTAIITDVRFPNEVEGIQAAGGKVIRFTRDPYKGKDVHPSETILDEYKGFDIIIDNSTLTIEEQSKEVAKVLTTWGW